MSQLISRFVDSNKILNFKPTNRTFLQILTALDTRSVMFARHIYTIFIIFVTNNTGIGISFLADVGGFDLAAVGLTGPDFED